VGIFTRKRKASPDLQGNVKALLFDTFGTTVDWYSGITAHGRRIGTERAIEADWEGLAKEWRSRYKPAVKPVREGKRKWTGFDTLHREQLDKIVGKFGAKQLTDADRDRLTLGWHQLGAWPDAASGVRRLRERFIVGPLSNGTTRQLIDLAKFSGLEWDFVFGADIFRSYKPDKKMYLGAAGLLGLEPGQILMVAAHNEDLKGASKAGLRTCFVRRATEDEEIPGKYDLAVSSFEELATILHAG